MNITNHDRYIYSTSFDEYEDERVEELFNEWVNDEDISDEALCIINDKNPLYMLDCYLNNTNPKSGSIYEETILNMVREHIQEYRKWG